MKSHTTIILAAMSGLAVTAGAAMGQINYVSQTRSVYASTAGGSESYSNTDIGPWSQVASSSYTGNGGGAGSSSNQASDLGQEAISFNFSAYHASSNGHSGSSEARLDTTFSLSNDTTFELVSTGISSGDFFVNLQRGTTTVLSLSGYLPQSTSGLLAAGEYRLRVTAIAYSVAVGPDPTGRGQGVLNIPTPGTAAALLVGLSFASSRRRRL